MAALGLLVAWLVVATSGAMATALWLRGLWKRRSELPGWSQAVAGLGATAALFGAFGTVAGLVKAFGAMGGESVDRSHKTRLLAEGLSEAMNCTAFGLLVGLPTALVLGVLTRTRTKHPD